MITLRRIGNTVAPGIAALAAALAVVVIALFSPRAVAETYYVRADGGSVEQCDGKTDAAFRPSNNTAVLECAWNHPFVALPPLGAPRIAGGDTLIIRRGSYAMGIGAPETDDCTAEDASNCIMPSIPSGPSKERPTRILGEGHDAGCPLPPELWANGAVHTILRLENSSNVEIACLELTDHSPCIKSHNRTGPAQGETSRCKFDAPPFGPWGASGIVAADSSDVVLRQLNIHGLATNGVHAGRLKDWTLVDVVIRANGWAGWDGNISHDDPIGSSNSGRISFTGGEIAWNGCSERYPSTEIFGCWAQQQGGYGDGLGTAKTGGHWVFEGVNVHHNTSDGLDLLYMDGSGSVTIRRVRAEANAGNQIKTAGPVLIENSILLGNCAFFTTFPTSNLTDDDHCRAMGNTLSVSHIGNSVATIRNNTLAGQGDCLLITVGGDRAARTLVQNTAFVGGVEWSGGSQGNSLTCGHHAEDSTAPVVFERNLFWNLKGDQCPPGSVCDVDPLLSVPEYGRYDATPQVGSPLIDSAETIVDLDHDFYRKPRASHSKPDIGAIEVQTAEELAQPPQ
ncbi:MAG: right-handed parallel beta-helix repeat-containing protein [Lysobacter sp.]